MRVPRPAVRNRRASLSPAPPKAASKAPEDESLPPPDSRRSFRLAVASSIGSGQVDAGSRLEGLYGSAILPLHQGFGGEWGLRADRDALAELEQCPCKRFDHVSASMFKRGITTLQQLLEAEESSSRLIGAHLLLELGGLDAETAARQRERIIRRMILPNTTGKTTWKNRFRDLDEEVARVLEARRTDSLRCLDIGVSDGITSLDLFSRLSRIRRLEYVMSDLNELLYIRRKGVWVDVCDDEGTLIQVVIGPFAVPVTQLRHMHPLQICNRLLHLYAAHFRRRSVAKAWQMDQERDAGAFRSECLLATEVQRVMESDPRLRFERMDVLNPPSPTPRYDFVRVVNVLNLANGGFGFSADDVRRGLASVCSMVAPGGYLLVGRTTGQEKPLTHATLLQEAEGRFGAFTRFGSGSELEPFLMETPSSSRGDPVRPT